MRNLRLQLHNRGDAPSKKEVTLPLNTLQISLTLLPVDMRDFLKQEEIDLSGCRDLFKEKSVVGTLIEIETAPHRLVIGVDTGKENSRQGLRKIMAKDTV